MAAAGLVSGHVIACIRSGTGTLLQDLRHSARQQRIGEQTAFAARNAAKGILQIMGQAAGSGHMPTGSRARRTERLASVDGTGAIEFKM